jgi:hypothetical protein
MSTAQNVLDDLIARHGGPAAFDSLQYQLARAVVRMMVRLQSAEAAEITRLAAAMASLMDRLPPVVAKPRETRPMPKGMSAIDACQAYTLMLHDENAYEAYINAWTDRTAPTVDALPGDSSGRQDMAAEYVAMRAEEADEPAHTPVTAEPPHHSPPAEDAHSDGAVVLLTDHPMSAPS